MNWSNLINLNNIVAVILGIVGLVWLIWSLSINWKINNINSWPKVNATVTSVFAVPANEAAGNTYVNPENIVASTDSDARYRPLVSYIYNVQGRTYRSDKFIYNDDRTYNPIEIKTLLAPFGRGSVHPVYYNPSNPSESYIYNSEANWVGPIVSAILLLLGLWLGFKGFQKYKKSTDGVTSFDETQDISLTELDSATAPKTRNYNTQVAYYSLY